MQTHHKSWLAAIAQTASTSTHVATSTEEHIALVHSFWNWEEIVHGLTLRAEWEVPSQLIPFYGDWHELICLDEQTGKIIYLNDEREIVHSWEDADDFTNSLQTNPDEDYVDPHSNTEGLISAKLNF